jgi:hypothetical protein
MSTKKQDFFRKRRICLWDDSAKHISMTKLNVSKHFSFLPQIDYHQIKSLDDPDFSPCDLLICYVANQDEESFFPWLNKFQNQLKTQNSIWTPVLFICDIGFSTMTHWLHDHANQNWYFDIIHPDHIASLPIRIANLLRIHDHLHELKRYHEQLNAMQSQITAIEKKLEQ